MLTLIEQKKIRIVLAAVVVVLMLFAEVTAAKKGRGGNRKRLRDDPKNRQVSQADDKDDNTETRRSKDDGKGRKAAHLKRSAKEKNRPALKQKRKRNRRKQNADRAGIATDNTETKIVNNKTVVINASRPVSGSRDKREHRSDRPARVHRSDKPVRVERRERRDRKKDKFSISVNLNLGSVFKPKRTRYRRYDSKYRRFGIFRRRPSRIFRRIVWPEHRRVICYGFGPRVILRYVYPYSHRKYVFVSLAGCGMDTVPAFMKSKGTPTTTTRITTTMMIRLMV